MKHMSALKKIIADCERQNKKQCIGLSFSIYLDDSEPEHYRTRGYKPNDQSNDNQPIHPQDEETPNEPI